MRIVPPATDDPAVPVLRNQVALGIGADCAAVSMRSARPDWPQRPFEPSVGGDRAQTW